MEHIKKRRWIPALFLLLLIINLVRAQTQEYLPLDSWVYPVLEEFRVRGVQIALWAQTRPYTREEIYHTIQALHQKVEGGQWKPSKTEQLLLQRLENEFKKEDDWRGDKREYVWRLQAFAQEKVRGDGDTVKGRGTGGASLGLHYGQRASLFSSILVDQDMGKDPRYTGYLWRGMYGDFDAAYVQVAIGPARFLGGRGKNFWGVGTNESLILSGNSPALDQLKVEIHSGPWAFSWFTAELDPLIKYIRPDTMLTVERANRFLVGHRADVKLGNQAELGISETFLYGGPNRQLELHYLNPLLLYHAVQLNDRSPGNTLLEFDGRWHMWSHWEAFGEVLIDDWQIDHKAPQDEKPPIWGFQSGLRLADPLGFEGSYIWANYTRVSNWTYNVYQPFERYIFKGKSLGWSGGNDGDAFTVSGVKHLSQTWDAGFKFGNKRHGEGHLDSPWPFVVQDEDTIFKKGFSSEPFPSGVVEKRADVELSIRWQPNADAWLEIGMGGERIKNENNISGNNLTSATGRLLVQYKVDWLVH